MFIKNDINIFINYTKWLDNTLIFTKDRMSSLHKMHANWTFWYAPRGKNSKVNKENNEDYESQLKKLGKNVVSN